MTDRISQAVLFGSVELALKQSFINVDNLLEWLSKQVVTQKIMIAYNAVCRRRSPNIQYLHDGVHILAKNPGLSSLAVVYKLNPSFKDCKEGESKELWNYVFESVIKMRNDDTIKTASIMMLTGNAPHDFLRNNLDLLYSCRFWREASGVPSHKTNEALLKSDWVQHLRSNGTLAHAIITRVHFLQQHAPQYYAEVAYKDYYAKAVTLHKEKLLTNLSQADLSIFNTYFTNIIDLRLLSYNTLCYNIASLTPDIAGYVLGFPIHWFMPNEEQIHDALMILKVKDVDDYCAYIKAESIANCMPTGAMINATFSNTEDVYGEDIDNYVPFDIIIFRNAKHIYRFTRPEFANLVKSKKNHWTNEWLPASILGSIKSRLTTVCSLGLPGSRTLKDHLNHLKNYNFFYPSPNLPIPAPSVAAAESSSATTILLHNNTTPVISSSPALNMDFEGDLYDVTQFTRQEHDLFHVPESPYLVPENMLTSTSIINHSQNDDDNDDNEEELYDTFHSSGFNESHLVRTLLSSPHSTFPVLEQQLLSDDIRVILSQWADDPQVIDVTQRLEQSNASSQELFRLIFNTVTEEYIVD